MALREVRSMPFPVLIRRAHRIIASSWLLFVVVALALEAIGGPESPLVTVPIVVLLLMMVVSGGYLLARPWVGRFRSG